ncbi:hypothetical protein BUALT_Bualt15G0112600 [Buddleja alternifolia]|uniref:F-box domain-containing protein n=1 Tax=Buddleja alternifolia TaxID=168488 RepID=A0AAV6WM39_9LAMI|nr:hypothetical protein BUALT_Bualt15G0112600 [Buddleja alternifolia]
MENPNLLQEILMEIFSRLPTKSIGKFRCLSKPCHSLLSTPQFIKTHFTRTTHQQENLILITPSQSLLSITTTKNDIVLLGNEEEEMLLVNPITLQHLTIPNSPLALNKYDSFSMRGFRYDTSSDDYKIVTLSYDDTDKEHEPDCIDTFVDVYSVKRGVWKRVDCSPYDHAITEISSGSFVNGAIH